LATTNICREQYFRQILFGKQMNVCFQGLWPEKERGALGSQIDLAAPFGGESDSKEIACMTL
jgi:hypothetical protein